MKVIKRIIEDEALYITLSVRDVDGLREENYEVSICHKDDEEQRVLIIFFIEQLYSRLEELPKELPKELQEYIDNREYIQDIGDLKIGEKGRFKYIVKEKGEYK